MTHAVIVGNGITGITAARRLRELEPSWRITVISGESTYHYSRPALMYVFMGHMTYADTKPYEDWVWARERIDLVRDWVVGLDPAACRLELHRGAPIEYDRLLLATGSKSNRFGWPGQDLGRVQGLYDLMDLKRLYESTRAARHAVIVGGGLIGIELAEMLHSRHIDVTFLVREDAYWGNVLPREEAEMVMRAIRAEGFDLRLETELAEIVGDADGNACAVITKAGERLETQLVGLTAGVSPNLDLVEETSIETGRGILVDRSLRTSAEDVFAAGDCAEIRTEGEGRNLLQQVWYTGEMQGRVAAESMAGLDVRYDPGIWWNSAKFLDIEYQTYGTVPSTPREGETHLWWESGDGRHGLRLVGDASGTFVGLNAMGLRYRHRACERWIAERTPLADVVGRLAEADFSTELVHGHLADITRACREQLARAEGATPA